MNKLQATKSCFVFCRSFGESLPATDAAVSDKVQFVIQYIYSDKKSLTATEARAVKWKNLKNKTTMHLPPDQDSLMMDIVGANYLAFIQKKFLRKVHPSPLTHGWHLVNGRCLPVQYSKPALTITLAPMEESEDAESSD